MAVAAQDLLATYTSAALQAMARAWHVEGKGNKAELVARLAETLYDPARIDGALAALSPAARALVDRLTLAGGELATSVARVQLQSAGVVDLPARAQGWGYGARAGSARALDSRRFEDVVARAGLLGIVFTARPHTGTMADPQQPGRTLFIPEPILSRLPPVTVELERAAPPPQVRAGDAAALLRDSYVLLSFADPEPIPLTTRGQIPKRVLVRIDEHLRSPEGAANARSEDQLGRLPFLRALAEDVGLLLRRLGALVLGDEVATVLGRPAGERQQRFFEAYRQTAHWCELLRIPGLAISGRGVNLRTAPANVIAGRRRVIAEIATLPAGEWIPLDHLVHRMQLAAYDFLFSRVLLNDNYYAYSSSYTPMPYSGANELGWTFPDADDEASGWKLVEAGMIRVVVCEALHWLAVVDVGVSDERPVSFRVTPSGARLLRGEAPITAEAAPNVVVQPNFQIFAFEPTGEDVLFTLDRFAERRRVEQVSEYELTRESVYRGARRGLDEAAMLEFLERVSRVGVPQNVRRSLEEWGTRHRQITVRRGVRLLEAADPATLDALVADPAVGPLLGPRLGPTAVLVPAARLELLYLRLLERGQLPALSEGPSAAPGAALHVDAAGHVTLRHRVPSVHVRGELRPFCDEQATGALCLTPQSLRRGAHAGLSADEIVGRLQRYHEGVLPEEVAALVRRWARDWGDGALVNVTLLQVDRAETLRDLLADPELRRYLQPLTGSDTLAAVQPQAVERLRAALDARGMVLGDRLR